MLKELRGFLLRGSLVDLAVAVVIGLAFSKLVASLVENLVTPLVSIPGDVDFSELALVVGGAKFRYGVFLNDLIAFILVASSIFFLVVKPMQALNSRRGSAEPTGRECPACLSTIPRAASRCAFCTTEVEPMQEEVAA